MHKYERLLYIINLIKTQSNLRASDIAVKCGVSKRTIYRDIMTLSAANIPIYYENGYKIVRGAALPPIFLTGDEAILLNMAVESTPLNEFKPLQEEFETLLAKINSQIRISSPENHFDNSQALKIAAVLVKAKRVSKSFYNDLAHAIRNNHVCRIGYRDCEGRMTRRDIYPYDVVFREKAFYLVAYCVLRKDFRVFRIERILELARKRKKFIPDRAFDVEQYFRYSWGILGGKVVQVRVRLSAKVSHIALLDYRDRSVKLSFGRDGSLSYTARISGLEEFARWVLGFGGEAQVLGPKRLADIVSSMARAAASRY